MKKLIGFVLFLLLMPMPSQAIILDLKGWQEISGKHFKIVFKPGISQDIPLRILNKAEEYYTSIADRIGYARYRNFWTWDERVSIVYFPSQAEYMQKTNQPTWSKGFAVSHLASVNLRMIVTYQDQPTFLSTVLPHEISHLILHDFIGPGRYIPSWFDEGVAQMEEFEDDPNHRKIFAGLIQNGYSIPLQLLQSPPDSMRQDDRLAGIFYAESLYIVDFLVKTYGKEDFVQLCRNLRDGKDFESSLKSAYYPNFDSLEALQKKWIEHMMKYL